MAASKITFQQVVRAVKGPTFIGFSIVSAALTMILYWNSGSSILDRVILGLTAFSLEGLKLYALLMGNIYFDYIRLEAKKTAFSFIRTLRLDIICRTLFKKGILMYFTYFLAAAVSIFGSYNFTLSTIDRSVRQNIVSQGLIKTPDEIKLASENEFFSKEIVRLESKIENDTKDYQNLPPDWITSKSRIQAKIDIDSNILSEYNIKRTENEYKLAVLEADRESNVSQIKKSSFQIMAENFSTPENPITAQQILTVLLLITSLLIEMGVVVTSPHEDTFNVFDTVSFKKKKEEEDSERIPITTLISSDKPKKKSYYKKKDPKDTLKVKQAAAKASRVNIKETIRVSDIISEVKHENTLLEKKASRIEVRSISPVHKFLEDILPENGLTGFLRKENMEKSSLPPLQAKEIFNNLTRSKGPTGFPIFEFRKDHGKWYSNYTLNDIISIIDKAS
jgi:hypothetical protein